MKKNLPAALLSALVFLSWSSNSLAAPKSPETPSLEALKEDKLKSLFSRDGRAEAAVKKAQERVEQLKSEQPDSPMVNRLEAALNEVIMTGSSLSASRLRADLDLLEAIGKNTKLTTSEELAPLTERYRKLAAELDDLIFAKDLERLLKKHDRLVRYTSLGLWDTNKISEELSGMEEMLKTAPDLPYGRTELLRGLEQRKLAAVPRLCYLGLFPQEEIYLTSDRRSVGILEESTNALVQLEMADMIIQQPSGELIDLTEANHPARGIPFSPPMSLWLKSRLLEGRVPAITLRTLSDGADTAYQRAGVRDVDLSKSVTAHDIATGKLDEYLRKNIKLLADTKKAVVVGMYGEFDRGPAALSFGEDGKTPYWILADPKLASVPADKLADELRKRIEKGAFTRNVPAELCNQYGDPAVPDGPERVRDAWKRVRSIVSETGGTNLAVYSAAGSFHASRSAPKFGITQAGNQAWNKLEYYWPGEGVLDWIGTSAVGLEPAADPKGANIVESVDGFMAEARTSPWSSTPVMLRSMYPSEERNPAAEPGWINAVFRQLLPTTYPHVSMVFVNAPQQLTLWARDGMAAYRTNVSSNKAYRWPLRFRMLEAQAE